MSPAASPPTEPAVELRRLTSAEQTAALVRIHGAVFSGTENNRLGARYLTAYFDWYRASPSAVALVAWRGEALGYVLGSPFGSERARYRKLLPAAAIAYALRPRLWLRRDLLRVVRWRLGSLGRATTERAVAELPAPVHLLDLIAVAPGERRHGLGARLLAGFADAARERGARSLVLWVRRDAETARRFYEKEAWRPAWDVWPDRLAYVRELCSS